MNELSDIARALDNHFNAGRKPGEPRKLGFVLMVFPFDGSADTLCVSNGVDRAQIAKLCRDTIVIMEKPAPGEMQ